MKSQVFNISLPQDLVKRADQVAQQEYLSRSALIKVALLYYIQQKEQWERVLESGKKIGKKLKISSEEQIFDLIDEYRHQS